MSHFNYIHGDSRKGCKEYKLWCAIKDRCYNVNCKEYKFYGGRGIYMYEPWLNDYPAFLAHTGRAPSVKHSMERRENDKGYEPGNLYWATKIQQARNRRSSLFVLYNGQSVNLKAVCEEKGLPYAAVWLRINRRKWTVTKALETPLISNKQKCA